jgi:hypothetical protein
MNRSVPSLISSLLFFALYFVALTVLMAVIVWAVRQFTGIEMSSSGLGAVAGIVAAMQVGQRFGARSGVPASGAYAWAASLGFTIIAAALTVVTFLAVASAMKIPVPTSFDDLSAYGIGPGDRGLVFGIIGALLLFVWVMSRITFGFGVRQGIKLAEKTAR